MEILFLVSGCICFLNATCSLQIVNRSFALYINLKHNSSRKSKAYLPLATFYVKPSFEDCELDVSLFLKVLILLLFPQFVIMMIFSLSLRRIPSNSNSYIFTLLHIVIFWLSSIYLSCYENALGLVAKINSLCYYPMLIIDQGDYIK